MRDGEDEMVGEDRGLSKGIRGRGLTGTLPFLANQFGQKMFAFAAFWQPRCLFITRFGFNKGKFLFQFP